MEFNAAKKLLNDFSELTDPEDKSIFYYQCNGQFTFNIRNMNEQEIEMALIHIWTKVKGIKEMPDDILNLNLN